IPKAPGSAGGYLPTAIFATNRSHLRFGHASVRSNGLVRPDACRPEIVVRRAALFSEIVPQPRQLDDVVRRQNRANQIRLRRGVNFIQVTLIFGLHYKLPDALKS